MITKTNPNNTGKSHQRNLASHHCNRTACTVHRNNRVPALGPNSGPPILRSQFCAPNSAPPILRPQFCAIVKRPGKTSSNRPAHQTAEHASRHAPTRWLTNRRTGSHARPFPFVYRNVCLMPPSMPYSLPATSNNLGIRS